MTNLARKFETNTGISEFFRFLKKYNFGFMKKSLMINIKLMCALFLQTLVINKSNKIKKLNESVTVIFNCISSISLKWCQNNRL